MARYVVEPRGPFSLEEVRGFLAEFGPAAHAAEPLAGHLHVAVVPDGSGFTGKYASRVRVAGRRVAPLGTETPSVAVAIASA